MNDHALTVGGLGPGRTTFAHRRRYRSASAVLGGVLLCALLALPSTVAIPAIHPSFTAGCQQVPSGTKIFSSNGTTSGGLYTYNNRNGQSRGEQTASSTAGGSAIYAGAYYFVGPSPSGCIARTTPSPTNFNVSYTWSVSVNPYLSANCTGSERGAVATYQVINFGNIHTRVSPFYVFPTHLQQIPFNGSVRCAGTSSSVYHPGTLGPTTVVIRSGAFSLPTGTWDFYSSVYGNTTTYAHPNSVAFAGVTIHAVLKGVYCHRC
jgi:hypothetical protein